MFIAKTAASDCLSATQIFPKMCIYIRIIYISSCVLELSTIHRMYRFLLFLVCPSDVVFFQAWPWVHRWRLWLWQQIGTILRFRWRVQLVHYSLQPWVPLHFEMSLMPVELERKQKESTTDAQTHRSTWKTKENVSKHIQNMFFIQKNTFPKTKNTNTTIWESAFQKKKRWSAVLIFLRRREDRKRCRALGVARAGREKREQIRQKFWCFDDFDVFFCVLLILFVFCVFFCVFCDFLIFTGSCRWEWFCWCWKKWNGEAWLLELIKARFVF